MMDLKYALGSRVFILYPTFHSLLDSRAVRHSSQFSQACFELIKAKKHSRGCTVLLYWKLNRE